MTSKRTPRHRGPREPTKFTPRALEAFREMQWLTQRCTCEPIDWDGKYWERRPCKACDQWWEQHRILSDELPGLPPWEWPVVEDPDAINPYPAGSYAAKRHDDEAPMRQSGYDLFRALEAALADLDNEIKNQC